MSISQNVYNKISYRFFVIHFPLLAILMLGAKLGRGCVPRDCLREEFCPSVLCNLIAPNKRSHSVPDSPIVQLAIFEFQKFSFSKRGYVQNVCFLVSYISMRIEAPFHISGSYLASP